MLSYLAVKNFAILENIEVYFEEGMTALTGETGAGKSLLIDAIGLLLGDRATSSIVRTGTDFCEVKGLFKNISRPVKAALKHLDIPLEDEVLITRQVGKSSQNKIKINHQTVTLQDLKLVTKYLADIHTQHDTKRLVNPDTYLALIDQFDPSLNTLKQRYHTQRDLYLDALNAYTKSLSEQATMLEKMDYYRFQLDDITKHALQPDEEAELDSKLEELENFDTIFQSVKTSFEGLSNQNALEAIYEAFNALKQVEGYTTTYQTLSERLQSAYYELDDIKDDLTTHLQSLDFDPDELDRLETRKHTLETLRRKYRKSIPEIIAYQKDIEEKLTQFEDYDSVLETKKNALEKAFNALHKAALDLRHARESVAKKIEETLIMYLIDLELNDAQFKVVFNAIPPLDKSNATPFKGEGIDTVDFHLSTNIGEPLKPLSKVASGGELSRIMLALKEILIENMDLSLMIFDEIDTGVSGYVASQVAAKMRKIAEKTQVITITHLPQVAARAHTHAYIYKSTDNNRTKAHIKTLDRPGRIQTLAEMISSNKVTPSTLKSAEELLK